MKSRSSAHLIAFVTAVMSLCFTSTATAQGTTSKFEITPFAGYRIGGHFEQQDGDLEFDLTESNAYGLILNGYVRENTQWEFLYAQQDTTVDTRGFIVGDPLIDIGVDYYQLGGTSLFDGNSVRPFIVMTLGMSRFDPEPARRVWDWVVACLIPPRCSSWPSPWGFWRSWSRSRFIGRCCSCSRAGAVGNT